MPHLCYQLKIVSAFENRTYRVLEIDGNRTFADLSDAILDAFDFDHSHLYMFSRSRKPYDPNGIYHPMSEGDTLADEVRLQDVKLVVRNKYLYLYDFGDEWMFYVTVTGIRETDQEIPVTMLQSQGDLCQYPDWEEDEEDEFIEEWDELSDGDGDLVIIIVDEADDIVAERLMAIPALLQQMWIRLIEKNLLLAGYEEINLLCRLEEAGLVDVDETEEHLHLKVKCGKKNWNEYGISNNLQRRCTLENTLISLAGIYGVIEQDMFYEVFCDYSSVPFCSKTDFTEVTERLSRWNFWTFIEMGNGKTYISTFDNVIAEEVLQKREKYPVKWYCIFEDSVRDVLASGDWKSAFPVYGRTYCHLFFECGWNSETVGELLEQLLKCVAMGMTEQEYFKWVCDSFEENGIHLTKRMKKLFRELRNEFPSAALRGYTWGEYEKNRKDGYQQLTLFEEESPFE